MRREVKRRTGARVGRRVDVNDRSLVAGLAKLEAGFEYVQRDVSDLKTELRSLRSEVRADFRLLFGTILTMSAGMVTLIAKAFGAF
ncbi:hypothetical protein ASB57_05890 [Bordetella sp. N]|nr:hypothetical protein ASB57_05890 [Bordetella sp. N]